MQRALLPRHLKFRPLAASLALATMACAQAQQALPTGLQVAAGQATAQAQGGVLTVTNSANAILNWQSFSIGAQNAVRFVQPSASSQVLNRVTGSDPSAILGRLSSNGRVWLLNPNGVLFGAGARVDVAGLVTSTLHMANEDWLAGRYVLGSGTAPAAGIVNQGELRTSLGGRVALVGGSVENQGLIEAPGGQVLLAAGRSVELVDTGAPNLAVRVTAPQGDVLNLGTLSAPGGRIDVHGAAVNQQGLVRADSLAVGPAGEIVLQASERLTLAAGSVTGADAAAGAGGQVKLLGREVGLFDGAAVSASGRDGGGVILAGGGAQGRDASVPNAQALFFGRDARLAADATGQGDGGHIVLWSDQATRAYGSLSAHGGARGGNGGLIETSGGWLDARPAQLDLAAPHGRPGTWLLDPYNITIKDGGSGTDTGYDPSFTAIADDAVISTAQLTAVLNQNINVTVSTGTGGSQAGNITVVNANINPSNTAPVTLTLQAAGDIVFDNARVQPVSAPAPQPAPLNLTLQSGGGGSGAISLNNSTLFTSGGNITLGGFNGAAAVGHAGTPDGIKLTAVDISTDAGGSGPTGDLTFNGRTAEAGGRGVYFAADPHGNNIVYATHHLTVTGTSSGGRGVEINDFSLRQAKGAVDVTGTGTDGLWISNQQSPPVSLSGASVTLTGHANGAGYGLYMESASASAPIVFTTAGDFQATGQNAQGGVQALTIQGGGTDVFSVAGNATLSAFGGGALLRGISMSLPPSQLVLFSDGTLTIDSSALTGYLIHVRSATTQLLGTTSLFAYGSGNAILIEGPSNNPTNVFDNQAGSSALALDSEGGGRWLIWSFDPAGSAAINLGGLSYSFQRYGANAVAAADNDAGNGVASYFGHIATVNGTVASRAYDGTTAATLTNLGFTLDVPGDTPGSVGPYTASFASKDAGTRAVSVAFGTPPQFFDAGGHPVYGYTVQSAASGSITPAPLTGSVSAANKVYDATANATVSVSGITGFIGSETVGVSATGSFADKNVGTGKIVTASYLLSDGSNGGLAANYQFQPPAGNVTANITRAPISFSATAQDKVYDALTGATLANIAITPLGSDQLTVNPGTASFGDKNVGTGKPVTISGASLSGPDAGNYQLSAPTGLTARITPATLTYLADPAVVLSGAPFPAFTGSVSGFAGADTLATATAGTAVYQASVANSAVPGLYAINGSGLSAANYVFVQDSRNAQALQILPGVSPAQETAQTGTAALVHALQASLPDVPAVSSRDAGLLDLTATRAAQAALPAAPAPGSQGAQAAFAPQPLGDLSAQGLASLLSQREAYKRSLFAESINRLEQNPTLADLPTCRSLQELAEGKCLLTEELKRQAQAAARVATTAEAGATPAMPPPPRPAAPDATTALTPATATTPAPAPLAAASQALLAPDFARLGKRPVRQAALPQITRKMALLIAAGQYQDPRVPSLANAVGDARAVGELLERQLGYETVVIENANRASVIAALNQLAVEAGPHDSVVVYYAGHGELVPAKAGGESQGYWQLVDSRPDQPESWLSNNDIARLLSQIGASQVALISDSCYSGALASGERLRAVPGLPDPSTLLARRSVVVMSSGGNEPVFDSGKDGHSPFAWNLMNTLGRLSGWQPGGNVFERVRFAVARELPQRPQYAAAAGHQQGGDYLFERRQLDATRP